MLAAYAVSQNADDPLSGLAVEERTDPVPRPGWEVVEMRAATVNHHDLWSLRGPALAAERLPMTLGTDLAGVTSSGREVIVHAVVTEERGWSLLSERVQGTLSERVLVPSVNLVDKPAELSFAEAACLPTAYLTAYRMLFVRACLRPGQSVLVQGVGGGVATAAIVLAVAAGLEVSVTSRSEDRLRRATALGAHHAVASGERLPRRVDAVIETVGSATWRHSLRSVVEHGTVVVAGTTSGAQPPADLDLTFWRQLNVLGSMMGTVDELGCLMSFLRVSGARPVIDSVRPLSEARAALARMASGEVFGKIVLTAGDGPS